MMIHIGEKIREIVEKRGMAKTELARRMNMTSSNIHKIFTRETIDTGLLIKLSEILEHDFFSYYPKNFADAEPAIKQWNDSDESKFYNEAVKRSYESKIEILTKEVSYLKEINKMLREKLESGKWIFRLQGVHDFITKRTNIFF